MSRLSIRNNNISVRAGIIDYPKNMYSEILHWALAVRKVWKKDQSINAVYDSQNSILKTVNEIKENPRDIHRYDSTISTFIYDITNDSKALGKILYDYCEKTSDEDRWSSKTEGLRSCNFNIYENNDTITRGSFYFSFPMIEASTTNNPRNPAIDEDTSIDFKFDKKSKHLTISTINSEWLEDTRKKLLDFATELSFNPEGLFRFIRTEENDEYVIVDIPKFSLYPKFRDVVISVDRYGIHGLKYFVKPLENYEKVVNMALAISEELSRAEDVLETFVRTPALDKPEKKYSFESEETKYGKMTRRNFKVDISDTEQYKKHEFMKVMPEDQPYDHLEVRLYEKKHEEDAGSHSELYGRIIVYGLTEYGEDFIKEVIKHELVHMMQVLITRRVGETKEGFGELQCIRCKRKFDEMPENGKCPYCGASIDYEKAGLPSYFDPYGYHRYTKEDKGGEDYGRRHAISDVEFFTRLVDAIEQMRRIVLPPALSIEEYDHFKYKTRSDIKPEDWKKIYAYRFEKFLNQNPTLKHLKESGQQQKYQKMLRELYRQFDNATKNITTAGDIMNISKRAKVTSDKPAYKEKKKTDNGYVWVYDEKHVEKRWKEKKDKLKKLEKDIKKVREQYKKDLKSDDERTRAIAAIVGIMDDTAMRIGNEESAKEGTFGASTLKVKHVKGGKGKMTFDFPGKGEIEQNVVLENNDVIKVIRDLMKGKKADDFIFEVDGKKIWDRAVNRYLKPLGISAKDLRGFHSNRLMKETLKKKDWKDALKEVSEIVGHEAATLKNQYLDPELVEKHEDSGKKKKAYISIRAEEYQTPSIEKVIRDVLKPEYGAGAMTTEKEPQQPQQPQQSQPKPIAKERMVPEVDIDKNVSNVQGDISNYPDLQRAWKILAPFLPDGATLTSGWRSDNDQARIILEYWLSARWKGRHEYWVKDKGFFHETFPGRNTNELRWWLGQVRSGIPITGRKYKQLNRDIEPLRQIMATYNPKGISGEPPEALQIAKLGSSRHLIGRAMDVSNANLWEIIRAADYVMKNLGVNFSDIRKERGQQAVHIVVEPGVTVPDYKTLATAIKDYEKFISVRASLEPGDERFVNQLEQKYFGKPMRSGLVKEPTQIGTGPEEWREHYRQGTGGWAKEENVFRLGDNKVGIRPKVKLTDEILSAWILLKPYLPHGAVMTSGVRTPDDQTRVINNYWKKSGLYAKYPNINDPYEMSKILKQNGWIVGPPTREGKKPIHGSGRAFDVSGPSHILDKIEEAARKVSSDPSIPVTFSQVLLERKNNDVHIGIKETIPLSDVMKRRKAKVVPSILSKFGMEDIEEDTKEKVSSIYEDLLKSNPPDDVVEEYREAFGEMLADDDGKESKYEKEKDDPKWNEVLIDKDRKWTRKEIRDHYMKNKSKIMKEVKGKPVMLFIGTGKNQNVLKRNHNDKKIVISNDKDYEYWADRRMISIHRVLDSQTTLGFVDLDVHGDFSDAKVREYAKKIASKIKSEYGGVTPTIYDSGGTGYHVEFTVDKTSTDKLRNELRELCEDLNEDFDGFTTGIVKGNGVRTDTTTLKNNGNMRVPYAIHEKYGGIKKPLGVSKTAAILDYSENTFNKIYDSVSTLAPFLVAETISRISTDPSFTQADRNYINDEVRKIVNAMVGQFNTRDDMLATVSASTTVVSGSASSGIELNLDLSDLKNYNEFKKEIDELQSNGRYSKIFVMIKRVDNAPSLASFANWPPGQGGQPLMLINFDPKTIIDLLLAGAKGFDIVSNYMETIYVGVGHELTHLTQSVLTDAILLKKGATIEDLNEPKDIEEESLRPEFAAGIPGPYQKERYGGREISPEEFENVYTKSDVEFFPILRTLIDEATLMVGADSLYNFEKDSVPEEYLHRAYLFGLRALPENLQKKLRHERLGKYIRTHSVLQRFKEQDMKKYNKAVREIYRYVEPQISGVRASISIRDKVALDLNEIKNEMGFGIDDEPGDWFEKSPIFVFREEVPEYEIDAETAEAKRLAKENPEEFFYRGLHKEHEDLESFALDNIIEKNPKFYFVFKYHKREEPEFLDLKQKAAEALSQQDPRAFFYYDLHHEMPELGRGAILQLIDKDPRSFGQLGLDKDYPDYIESATNAINIYDPTKVDIVNEEE